MEVQRVYEPKKDEIIYHYCNAQAFHCICSQKKLWLNDLHSMNDSLEILWGFNLFKEISGELSKKYGKEFIDKVESMLLAASNYGVLLSTCFSKERDVLSQWRAYADDGHGYVIGFSASDLLNLPIRALKVLYDKEEQKKEIIQTVDELSKIKDPLGFKAGCTLLTFDFAAFKNPAFAEEKEIRLIHALSFVPSNTTYKIIDYGGRYFGSKRKGEEIKYRMKNNMPTPFIEIDFTNELKVNPIREVVIGPKNYVRNEPISYYLETLNLPNVTIIRSEASYR